MAQNKRTTAMQAMQKAVQCYQAGEFERARKHLKKVLGYDASNADANHLMGVLATAGGRPEVAVKFISKAIRANGRVALAHNNLGEAHRALDDWEAAEASYRRALELEPREPGFLNNLGITLQAREQHDDARAAYEKAFELAPQNPMILTNYANFLCQQEDLALAVQLHETVVSIAPDYAEGHANFAIAIERTGATDKAVEHYRKAIELNPGHANALKNFAQLSGKCGASDRAISLFYRAIEADPDDQTTYIELAYLLRDANKPDESIAVFERLKKLKEFEVDAEVGIANIHRSAGNKTKAIDHFNSAFAIDPMFGEAASWVARLTKHASGDAPAIAKLNTLLSREELEVKHRVHMEFTLGKVFEDLGEYDKSIAHIKTANALKRDIIDFDPQKLDRFIAGFQIAFTGEFFRSISGQGCLDRAPVFIVGMPRSGTSLVEQILSSHSRVTGAGELQDMHFISGQFEAQAEFEGESFPECFGAKSGETYATVGTQYLSAVRNRFDYAHRFTDKMPHNFVLVGLIAAALPNAQIIHCRRHPMDTCLSIFKNDFTGVHDYAFDQRELAEHYRSYEKLMNHWRTVLPGVMLEVRYEDVVANVEAKARELIAFLGLEWENACLEFYNTKRLVNTISASQVREPIYTRSVDAWKHYEADLQPLIEALGDSIANYERGLAEAA